MKTRSLVFCVLAMIFISPFVTFAAGPETSATNDATSAVVLLGRTELKLRMTPATRAGSVSANFGLDVTGIVQNGESVTGKVTQYWKGPDGCRLTGVPVVGGYDGETLILNVSVSEDDNLSCRIALQIKVQNRKFEKGLYLRSALQIKKGQDGKFEGLATRGAVLTER